MPDDNADGWTWVSVVVGVETVLAIINLFLEPVNVFIGISFLTFIAVPYYCVSKVLRSTAAPDGVLNWSALANDLDRLAQRNREAQPSISELERMVQEDEGYISTRTSTPAQAEEPATEVSRDRDEPSEGTRDLENINGDDDDDDDDGRVNDEQQAQERFALLDI